MEGFPYYFKNKKTGVQKLLMEGRTIVEAVV